ncbi:Thiol:disulfide interchange protein DsbD [Methylophilaceae bacterium]|nr:Thiol:disulfide interchange protein DsbD [Methylophilaceae bacterium]
MGYLVDSLFKLTKVFIVTLLFSIGAVQASPALFPIATTEHVRAQLVASVDAVYPGAEILLGLNQRIIPHWHTYWQNSGDSGVPTTIDWELPKGAEAGEIQWPIPRRFKLGPVTNYGYEDEVTLLSSIKVPANVAVGNRFSVRAKVNWLVCHEVCVPEEVDLSLSLPVVADTDAAGKGSPTIQKALSTLPVKSVWLTNVDYRKNEILLRISGNNSAFTLGQVSDINFYPLEWGVISHNADQGHYLDGDTLVLKLKAGEAPPKPGEALSGVLVITEGNGSNQISRGFSIHAVSAIVSPAVDKVLGTTVGKTDIVGLPAALLLALLGGVILNLMPCVFPVLSIKALSLLNHAQQGVMETRRHGIAYTLGILSSFALLGGLLIAFKAGGAQIGWGFQFQSPVFVLIVAYLMFAVGLSLSGVFTIGGSVLNIGSSLAERPGYSGSFFTGVLATIVATPCTAPFMGAALGYALAQSPAVLLSVFLSLGLGLALPYLLLSTWPLLQRWLPRPGMWMERVKQVLAFPMYLAAVWLIWVLSQQAGVNAVAIALGGMVAIAFSAWLYQTTRISGAAIRHGSTAIAAIVVVIVLVGGYVGIQANPAAIEQSISKGSNWEPYTVERLQELRTEGKPVFLNFTAAWCISCLANERVALSDSKVIEAFERLGITYLKGDWTNQDIQITKVLKAFGRSGVPLYVVYPAGNSTDGKAAEPTVLPQILTPEIVLNAIAKL